MPHEPPDRDENGQVNAADSRSEFEEEIPATSVEIPVLPPEPPYDEALELSDVEVVDDAAPPRIPAEATGRAPPPVPVAKPPPLVPAIPEEVSATPGEDEVSPRLLEDAVAEARGDDAKHRACVLESALAGATDKAQVALFAYELGELYERRLGDESAAVKSYSQALKADPSFRPNLWAIRRVFYRRALWPNLLKLIDVELRSARSPDERAELYVEKGQILEDRTKDRRAACEAFDAAIALCPVHQPALLHRERIALAENDRTTLAHLWRKLASAVTSPGRRVAYLLDLARLEEVSGEGGPVRALELLAEAAALGVERERIARMTFRVARAAGQPGACLGALEARIQCIAERLGQETEGESADRRAGLEHEILVLRRQQARVARDAGEKEGAWSYLEQAAALAPHEPLLLMDLCTLAEALGKSEEQAALLGRLLGEEADPQRRLALGLLRAAALRRAGKEADAEAVIAALEASMPDCLPVLAWRQQSALRAGAWDKVAEILMALARVAATGSTFGADGEADPSFAAASLVGAGEVLARQVARGDEARAAYEQALDIVPGYPPAVEGLLCLDDGVMPGDAVGERLQRELSRATGARRLLLGERLLAWAEGQDKPDVALRALEVLVKDRPEDRSLLWHKDLLLSQLGRTDERVELYRTLADRMPDAQGKADVLFGLAELHDRQARPDDAIAALREALGLNPDDRVARAWLTELLRETGRWDELYAERSSEARSGGRAATSALREAAALCAGKLDRPEEAAELYGELLGRLPGDAATQRALVLALSARPTEQALAMETEAEALSDGVLRSQALLRLGEHYEAQGQCRDALAAYRRAVEAHPESTHASWAAYELAARLGDAGGAALALRGITRACTDDQVRADLLEELAWHVADDPGGQVACLDEALSLSPQRSSALLGRTLALVAERGRDDDPGVVSALVGMAERMPEPRVGAALLLYAASRDEASGGRQASALAQRALTLTPGDAGSVLAVVDRRPADAQTHATELWQRRRAIASTPELGVALDLEWAAECEAAGRLAQAGRILGRILTAIPRHVGALWALRRIAYRAGDAETMARASLVLAESLADDAASAQLLSEAALLLVDVLYRPKDAVPVLRAALERAPHDENAYVRLHGILTAQGDKTALLELVTFRARHLQQARDALPYHLESASLRHALADLTGSAEDFSQVLADFPEHREALSGMAEIRLAQGAHREAAAWLVRYVAAGDDPELIATAQRKLALLYAEKLGDAVRALPPLEKALEADPSDVELREVLVRVLTFLGEYERAATECVRLASRREARDERAREEVRAARLYAHRLGDAPRAVQALARAQALVPRDLEILRPLLRLASEKDRPAIEGVARDAARSALVSAPSDATHYAHLAAVCGLVGDEAGGEIATAAERVLRTADLASGLGTVSGELSRPVRPVGNEDFARLSPAMATPTLYHLWCGIAEGVVRGGAETPLVKKDLVPPKLLAERWPAVYAVMSVFGLEAEIYVSAERPDAARALPYSPKVLLLGVEVAEARTPRARFLLYQTLGSAAFGASGLPASAAELVHWLAAAVLLAGGDPSQVRALAQSHDEATKSGRHEEYAKALGKGLSRKDRKALPSLTARLSDVAEVASWLAAMQVGILRLALLLSGDLRAALAIGRGAQSAADVAGDQVATELLVWATSEEHLALKRELGL
jgi:tetratricopeptide (TPR) repeat protein